MPHRSPLQKAVAEAGVVVLGAVLIAVAVNIFSSSPVPWIAHPAGTGDTVSVDDLLAPMPVDTVAAIDTNMAGPDTAATATDTAALNVPDTATPSTRPPDTPASRPAPTATTDLPKEIGTATAKQLFDRKAAAWFDARQADDFARGHIPGAHNVYAYDFQNNINRILMLGIPREQPVVVYCSGGLCDLSHELAANLRQLGFQRVVVYTGGTEEWAANKYPLTTGE